jgi:surface antigen
VPIASAILVNSAQMTSADLAAVHVFLGTPVAIRTAATNPQPSVQVISAFVGSDGRPCRRVEETISMGGKSVRAWGDICEAPPGNWALTQQAAR